MKIIRVRANSRKRQFEVGTRKGTLVLPFAHANPAPSSRDPLKEVFVDTELGREAFTYSLASGAEGTVHIDSVLEYNEDPNCMAELALYQLTTEARKKFEASPLSAREVARRLGTSPTQLYRLLDSTNYSKSMRQLLSLLYILGYDVDVDVKARASECVAGNGSRSGEKRGGYSAGPKKVRELRPPPKGPAVGSRPSASSISGSSRGAGTAKGLSPRSSR